MVKSPARLWPIKRGGGVGEKAWSRAQLDFGPVRLIPLTIRRPSAHQTSFLCVCVSDCLCDAVGLQQNCAVCPNF
jgi:hypothetical protein